MTIVTLLTNRPILRMALTLTARCQQNAHSGQDAKSGKKRNRADRRCESHRQTACQNTDRLSRPTTVPAFYLARSDNYVFRRRADHRADRNVCPTKHHARFRHPHSRRPRAQSARHRSGVAPQPADLLYGGERVGEELAGLRHALCRGAAALRAKSLQFRPAVSRADAQARRGPDLRSEPGHLDLAEDGRAEPALDGRHDHRDL